MSNSAPLSPDVLAAAPHLASILASGHYTSVAVYTIRPNIGRKAFDEAVKDCR